MKIFYAGIAYGAYLEDMRKVKKEGLPVKKLAREFPYLLGKGRGAKGKLQVCVLCCPNIEEKHCCLENQKVGKMKWQGSFWRKQAGELF